MNDIDSIELRHLRYFLAVATELHFGRAAELLGIAQPPLSQQIQKLEEMIGQPLFVRRPKVQLTTAGEALREVAQRTLGQVRLGLTGVQRAATGETGSLTIGFAASALLTPLTAAIRRYHERYPRVDLQLRELSTADQQSALMNGSIDVGFLRQPLTVTDGLRREIVMREPFLVVLPPRHPLAERRQLPIGALETEPFVQFPRTVAPGLYDQVISLCTAAGFTPNIVQEAREWLTIVGLVEAGLGLSLVPASFQRLKWGGVQYRRLKAANSVTTVEMSWPESGARATVSGFVDVARQEFRRRDPTRSAG